jgi:hypothetical protein
VRKRSIGTAVLAAIAAVTLSLASDLDLEITGSGLSGSQISVTVHNSEASSETARIRATVRLSDQTTVTLTSSNITFEAGSTTIVTLTAAQAAVGIIDDPQPISPAN